MKQPQVPAKIFQENQMIKPPADIVLDGLRVIVTRPSPAGELLCQAIKKSGGKAIHFPTIDIVPLFDSPFLAQQLAKIDRQDWLIFISPQSVYTSSAAIKSYWSAFPAHVKIAAVGAGTAHALEVAGLPVDIYPEEQWSSEGLLNLSVFQTLTGKKIMLFRGEGGREWLAESLTVRGALVSHAISYRRCLPDVDVSEYLNLMQQNEIDVITTASGEGLRNLKVLLASGWSYLQNIPIVVISQHMVELAENLGFKKILLAKNASHVAVMEILDQMRRISHD